ncbi:MAG: DUF4346 domain-containing protein [archaeon]|nr:DUF4346 domain-containing protein [archaeon]
MGSEYSEEKLEYIDTSDFKQKWILDPKGYFLIRIDAEKDLIEVGHCHNVNTPDWHQNNKPKKAFSGKTPESIMYAIIDYDLISILDHAAYLGKELQKAHLALKLGLTYQQDSELKINPNCQNKILVERLPPVNTPDGMNAAQELISTKHLLVCT